MGVGVKVPIKFGEYEFDSASGKLVRDGWPVKIQPQPLRVLAVLLESPGKIVSREDLQKRIWGEATFVEFDQGLNYCIRQIRVALRDEASRPVYIETLPRQGYRFIAPVDASQAPPPIPEIGIGAGPSRYRRFLWWVAAMAAVFAIGGFAVYHSLSTRPFRVQYAQLTDFTDSALAPVLSPDGRMIAFIRGSSGFLTADQIYVKMLPSGEAKRITDDPRPKYGLAFSPDGSQVTYTVAGKPPSWDTYSVSISGGDPHLFMSNASGLTWMDRGQLLFSEFRSGIHLGVVTGTATRGNFRDLYLPPHERGMAHYSYASPDRKLALVVEMNETGGWAQCRLISLDGALPARPVGPQGACKSAGWSPEGTWMYFTATVDGRSHLWRQRAPDGPPEQLTFGPTEEEGLAVAPDGRSLITSMGGQESAIWFHDAAGERPLSSEGEIVVGYATLSFSADGKTLYYLLKHEPSRPGPELWRTAVETGVSEAVLPGVSMMSFDVSPDGRQVVYSTKVTGAKSQVWIAPIDRGRPPARIGEPGATFPRFGADEKVLFQMAEGNVNYLEQMKADGSGRSRLIPNPIVIFQGVSPDRGWVTADFQLPGSADVAPMAVPAKGGGPPRRLCASYCTPVWSPNGKFLVIEVEEATRTTPGRSLAIPVGAAEALPDFPRDGIAPGAEAGIITGSQSINRAYVVPGNDPARYAYVNTTVHRNLYRVTLP